jgi:hypothetical protein
MLKDSPQWPVGRSRFYVGIIPKLNGIFVNKEVENKNENCITRRSLVKFLHMHAVWAAGRIWGYRLRELALKYKGRENNEELTEAKNSG